MKSQIRKKFDVTFLGLQKALDKGIQLTRCVAIVVIVTQPLAKVTFKSNAKDRIFTTLKERNPRYEANKNRLNGQVAGMTQTIYL